MVRQYIFDPHYVGSFIDKADALSKEPIDGIILSPIFYRESLSFFERWKNQNIPFVLFNTQIAEFNPLSYVGQDLLQSGYLAAKLIHYGEPAACSVLIAHIDEEISNAAHLITKEKGFREYFSRYDLQDKYEILRIELNRCSHEDFINRLDDVVSTTPAPCQHFCNDVQSL